MNLLYLGGGREKVGGEKKILISNCLLKEIIVKGMLAL